MCWCLSTKLRKVDFGVYQEKCFQSRKIIHPPQRWKPTNTLFPKELNPVKIGNELPINIGRDRSFNRFKVYCDNFVKIKYFYECRFE